MGYNSNSGEDSSHGDDETAQTPPDHDQQQTQSIQLMSRDVLIYEPFSYFSSFSSVSKNQVSFVKFNFVSEYLSRFF